MKSSVPSPKCHIIYEVVFFNLQNFSAIVNYKYVFHDNFKVQPKLTGSFGNWSWELIAFQVSCTFSFYFQACISSSFNAKGSV